MSSTIRATALVIIVDNLPLPTSIHLFTSGSHFKKVVPYLPTLRLFFDGGVCNDYRLRAGSVEFRINEGPWRVLDESDVALHYRFNTEVGSWLRRHALEANPHGKMSH